MTRIVEVAAGVLLREDAAGIEYLLAQRPPGKVYAGYWEFPGGKLEPGESFHDALVRELHEELGIAVTAASPWLCREFTYPHARVRLKFFRVTDWRGEIVTHDHSAAIWTRIGKTPAAAPLLPANGPILRALTLPDVYAVTHAEENGVDAELERIRRALTHGVRLLQLRDKTLAAGERWRFAEKIMDITAGFPETLLLVNSDEALARDIAANGVHIPSARLHALTRRPNFDWVAASCHCIADLACAEQFGIDFAVLGPVLPTATHPESPGIGWKTFSQWIEYVTIPVFAIGGMRLESAAPARRHGAHGIALLRGW